MAGVVDVLLKIVGDSRDAVQSVNEVGNAAERSTGRVSRLGESLSALAVRAAGVAGAAVGIVEAFQQAAGRVDQALGLDRDPNVGRATSPQDTARRLMGAGGFRFSDLFQWSNLRPRGFLGLGVLGGAEADPHARERIEEAIRNLAVSDPEQLASAIPFLQPARADYARAQLVQARATTSYQQQLRGMPSTVVHVNTGVGDPNRVGDEVAQALQRANRNNARGYTTTLTRG